MNALPENACAEVDAYLDGELPAGQAVAFARHLAACPDCQAHLRAALAARAALLDLAADGLPEDADLRIRLALREETGPAAAPGDGILDLEDVARLLKIPVADAVKLLDELPAFEVGGRIRFRRQRIEQWIADQEMKLSRSREQSAERVRTNIIRFPGGAR